MESNGDSNAHWLYHQCSTARTTMGTPITPLQLSIEVLKFIKSIGEDEENADQMKLFAVLKNGGKAKKRDLNFVYEIIERAMVLRDDEKLSEGALREVAAREDGTAPNEIGGEVGVAEVGGGNNIATADDSAGDEIPIDAARTQSAEAREAPECTSVVDNGGINFDELHCFQLRTRVLGLALPSFTTKVWKYLQAVGWTHSSGKYHIPKGRKIGMKYDTENIAKRVYKHFNLDNTCIQNEPEQSDREESDEEEGPETFDIPNDLVDYLDELCMPDYRSTSAGIQIQHATLSTKSKAYKRRNKRLRFEVLEVAYRERVRESGLVQQEQHDKYGHNHRPCEVCFKGENHPHPRVACRGCGLVVHTNCYGLLDHGEKEANHSRSIITSSNKGAEVDEKGLFTCDVCANSLFDGNLKQRWNATQSSGWRVHHNPNAICPLCNRNDITGGMIKIVVGGEGGTDRKRKSRRSAEPSENWVHLFCINSLSLTATAPGSIRNSSNAVLHIRNELVMSTQLVKEAESMQEKSIKCVICHKGKGDLVQCKGKCGRFFHRLCLQIDCLDIVGWNTKNTKKEHLCRSCRSMDHASHPDDEVTSSLNVSSASLIGSSKVNVRAGRVKTNGEEVDQYFDRKSGKKSLQSEGALLVVPSQQDCVAEVEPLHRHSHVDHAFDTLEVQYQQQFSEWSFSMATNQSILLYGLGSKASVLTSFGQYLSTEGDVVSLNGYDPNIDLNHFLDCLDELFCDGSELRNNNSQSSSGKSNIAARVSNKGLAKKAASIAKMFASTRSRPLFVLIHNIDGVGLRNHFAQDTIATLTTNSRKDGSPLIRVAASVDNVNAAMVLWSPQIEHKFDWGWKKVHTHRPYFEEVRSMPQTESSKKVKKSKGNEEPVTDTAVLKVLTYLAPRNTEVLQVLAALQLSSSTNSISYNELKDGCLRKMLTGADQNLKNIIKELSDHKMIGQGRDAEGIKQVFVPPAIPLQDIINFKGGITQRR